MARRYCKIWWIRLWATSSGQEPGTERQARYSSLQGRDTDQQVVADDVDRRTSSAPTGLG